MRLHIMQKYNPKPITIMDVIIDKVFDRKTSEVWPSEDFQIRKRFAVQMTGVTVVQKNVLCYNFFFAILIFWTSKDLVLDLLNKPFLLQSDKKDVLGHINARYWQKIAMNCCFSLIEKIEIKFYHFSEQMPKNFCFKASFLKEDATKTID